MTLRTRIQIVTIFAACLLHSSDIVQAASRTWDGGGTNNNWSTPGNWDGDLAAPVSSDSLTFDGMVRLTPNNNLAADSVFGPITFTAGAGSYVITGNRVTLGGDIADSSPNPQTANLPMILNSNRTVSVDPGAMLTMGGMISQTGGTFGLTKSGGGTLVLGANNTYTGATIIDGGTLSYSVDQTALPALTFGVAPSATSASTNVSTLDLTNANITTNSLTVQTNSATANTISIGTGRTLTVNGPVTVGVGTIFSESNSAARTVLNVTGNSLVINGGTNSFQLGVPRSNGAGGTDPVATLDLSGLSNFSYTGTSNTGSDASGEFRVGQGGNLGGTLLLANTSNTITATNVRVGDTNQPNPGSNVGNNGSASTVTLGAGSNVINATSIVLGAGKTTGNMLFAAGTSTGTLTIAGPTGGTSTADIIIGQATAATNSGTGTLNLDGHTATIQAGTVTLGRLNNSTGGTAATGTVRFDTGTFNIANLRIANQEFGTNTNGAIGTFFLGGSNPGAAGTGVLNVTNQFLLANRTNASGGTANGTFNIYGGTANLGTDILDGSTTGTRSTTLTLDGGTLNMSGHNIGSYASPITNINLNNGTLNNAATIAGKTINLSTTVNIVGAPIYVVADGGTLTSSLTTLTLASGGGLGGGGGGAGTVSGDVVAGSGSRITPGSSGATGLLQFNNNLSFSGGSTARFKLSENTGSGNDQVGVVGNLSLAGTVNLEIGLTGLGPQVGSTYTLFTYSGALTGNQSNFAIVGPQSRETFTFLSTASTPGSIQLSVGGTAPVSLSWVGNVSNTWNLIGIANFRDPALKAQQFFNQDTVAFDDSSTNLNDVQITGQLAPGNVTVSGSRNYKFAGLGSISGTTGLTKSGTGTLILATTNTYSGTTDIQSGTVQIGDGGTTGNIGSGNINIEGSLVFNRSDSITIANLISGTAGTVSQEGSGTLILSGANTLAGGVTIDHGFVRYLSPQAPGTGTTIVNPGGTLVVGGTLATPITVAGGTVGSVGSPNAVSSADFTIAPNTTAKIYTADPQNLATNSEVILMGTLRGSGNINVVSGTAATDPDGAPGFRLRGTLASDFTGTVTLRHNVKGELQAATTTAPSPGGMGKFVVTAGDVKLDGTTGALTANGGYSELNLRNTSTGDVTFGNDVEIAGSGLAILNPLGTAPVGATVTMGNLKIGGGQQLGIHLAVGNNPHNILFQSVTLTGGNVTFSPRIAGFGPLTTVGSDLTLSNISETAPSSITMNGLRTLFVNGTNSYSGPTLVSSGTLGGTGSVPGTLTVNAGAFLAPGDNTTKIGSLTSNNVSLSGTLNIDVNDGDANVQDVLNVTSSLALANAALNLNVTGTPTQPAYIFAHYATLTGNPFTSFVGLPDGYTINYNYQNSKEIALVTAPPLVLGDFDRNGHVNSLDVKAMLTALTDLKAYKAANSLTDANLLTVGDIDGSGTVTNADVQSLLTLLKNGGGSAAVPEPDSIALTSLALPGLVFAVFRRRRSLSQSGLVLCQ